MMKLLVHFLPAPVVRRGTPSPVSAGAVAAEANMGTREMGEGAGGEGPAHFDYDRPLSIGRVSGYHGQFLMEVRALTYLLAYGKERMADISRHAVLNANYVRARIKDVLPPAHDRPCMHEVVVTAQQYKKHGVRALDISKRLIDYGFHPMTIYFPLIVQGAMLIEPTESVGRQEIGQFIEAMQSIAREALEDPEMVRNAPHTTRIGRLDEAAAARKPVLRWRPAEKSATA